MRWNPMRQALLACTFIQRARMINCLARPFRRLEEVKPYAFVNRRNSCNTGKAIACAPLARFYNEANTQGVCYRLNNDLTLDEPSSECNFDRVRLRLCQLCFIKSLYSRIDTTPTVHACKAFRRTSPRSTNSTHMAFLALDDGLAAFSLRRTWLALGENNT